MLLSLRDTCVNCGRLRQFCAGRCFRKGISVQYNRQKALAQRAIVDGKKRQEKAIHQLAYNNAEWKASMKIAKDGLLKAFMAKEDITPYHDAIRHLLSMTPIKESHDG